VKIIIVSRLYCRLDIIML